MRRFFVFMLVALGLVVFNQSCNPEPVEELGSIYGIVTDKATGEPVKNANVQLRPSGETSLTGSDGRYEFLELKNGNYSITVSKTDYTDLVDDYVITVDGSKAMRRDVQIEKLPAALRIIDNNGNDIDELDFGSMHDDISRMFNIFNNSTSALEYEILKTASWITDINSTHGTLQPGATKPIVVNIDRSKMSIGDNITSISITTNNGGKQLSVKANKAGDISTFDAIEITHNSAMLRGSINKQITYSEKGFYYGTDMNTITKQTVNGYNMGEYSFNLTNLQEQKTYYYKAYMIVDSETIFGEMRTFTTNNNDDDDDTQIELPVVTTSPIGDITTNSAICGGNVTSDGGSPVAVRGVCWSTSQNPTINSNKTNDGSGSGSYSSNLTNLSDNTTYYVRAYATNSEGTSYGEMISFTTEEISLIGEINGYEYVDLGLPSGIKWATCNVGASTPEMPGDYYAWGEIEVKDYYGSDNCSTYEVEMEDISGDPNYDVARAKWGSTWRMPKVSEINELKANCSYPEEIEINGKKAYKYTSNINGCSIILPHTGYKSSYSQYSYNAYGCYWSSTPYTSTLNNRAYAKEGFGNQVSTPERYQGFTVRPVSD